MEQYIKIDKELLESHRAILKLLLQQYERINPKSEDMKLIIAALKTAIFKMSI